MKRIFYAGLICVCLIMLSHPAFAQSWELDISAGANSATGGLHYRNYIETGFLKFGGTGLYADHDDKKYYWGSVDFTVGTDTLAPGLTCGVGIRGLLGSAEEPRHKGDVGAVGFTGDVSYLFSREVTFVPIEVFSTLTYAPDSLSFQDSKSFTEFTLGAGVRLARSASILVSYTNYHLEMEAGPGDWSLNDDQFRIGLAMRF